MCPHTQRIYLLDALEDVGTPSVPRLAKRAKAVPFPPDEEVENPRGRFNTMLTMPEAYIDRSHLPHQKYSSTSPSSATFPTLCNGPTDH